MIEYAMIFMLGFLTAGLLALACLPAVWHRAMRLSRLRLGRLVPLSMDEIVAERDQIRAGFAVEHRRLEQKLERVEAARAETLVELGRSASALTRLKADFATSIAESAALRLTLDTVTRDLYDVRGQIGSAGVALHDISHLAERRRWEILDARGKIRALDIAVDEGRATIAGLETRIAGLDARVFDLRKALAEAGAERAAAEIAEQERLAAAERALEADEADLPALRAAIAKVADDVLRLTRVRDGGAPTFGGH